MTLDKKDKVYIGKVLKRLRKDAGISQEKLAVRSKMDRSYISALERDLKSPSVFIALKLAMGFEVEPGMLLNEIQKDICFSQMFENL